MPLASPRGLFAKCLVLVLGALLVACSSPSGSPTSAPAATTAPAAAAKPTTAGSPAAGAASPATAGSPAASPAAASSPVAGSNPSTSAAPAGNLSGKLTIAGSSALQPLIDQAAKNFQAANKDVQITVSAGGSGSGRTGVCNGSLDIGMSDVQITDQERQSLNCQDAVQTAVAIDAFATAANPKGPGNLKALTKEQLQGIFSGTTKNWSEVGGDNQAIVLVNRAKGSGTRQSMANYLYGGDDTKFGVGESEEDNSQTVVNTVAQTPGAVSYLGLAFLGQNGLVTIGLQDGSNTLQPDKQTVASGKWPIGGPGQAITKGQPNELEAAFLNYIIGPDFAKDPIWDSLGLIVPAKPAIGNPNGS